MRQPFRLLVIGSRTWDDPAVIEHALAATLAPHPGGVLLVHGACPAEPTPSQRRMPPGHPDTTSRPTRRTGAVTAGAPGSCGTPRWSGSARRAAPRSCEAPAPAPRPPSGWPGPQAYPSGFIRSDDSSSDSNTGTHQANPAHPDDHQCQLDHAVTHECPFLIRKRSVVQVHAGPPRNTPAQSTSRSSGLRPS